MFTNPKYFAFTIKRHGKSFQQLIPKRTLIILLPSLLVILMGTEWLQNYYFPDWNYWLLSFYVLVILSIPGLVWKGIIFSFYRGLLALRKAKWEEALIHYHRFEKQCAAHPKLYHTIQFFFDLMNPFTYLSTSQYYIALCYWKLGQIRESQLWCHKALTSDAQNKYAQTLLRILSGSIPKG